MVSIIAHFTTVLAMEGITTLPLGILNCRSYMYTTLSNGGTAASPSGQ